MLIHFKFSPKERQASENNKNENKFVLVNVVLNSGHLFVILLNLFIFYLCVFSSSCSLVFSKSFWCSTSFVEWLTIIILGSPQRVVSAVAHKRSPPAQLRHSLPHREKSHSSLKLNEEIHPNIII